MFGMSGLKRALVPASVAIALGAAPAFAQARGQAPATTPAPAAPATGQTPAAPAQAPATQPPAAPAQPPAPFPVGAKIAFVNLQQIAQDSADGKASAAKVQKTMQDKQTEAGNRQKQLQQKTQQLQSGGSVMNEQARAQLEKDIQTMQRDNDRFEQDAQQELQELQQQLQNDLLKKLFPVLEEIRKDRGLWAIFSAADAGVIVADQGLDLTDEAVKRMDAKK
jgi:Skp family chaperone for outer membrane proteins